MEPDSSGGHEPSCTCGDGCSIGGTSEDDSRPFVVALASFCVAGSLSSYQRGSGSRWCLSRGPKCFVVDRCGAAIGSSDRCCYHPH